MVIGERLRQLRKAKGLSQGDVEKRTGLLRCYTSRVEHGATVPTVETLEKYARALEVPLYRVFYDGTKEPQRLSVRVAKSEADWGETGSERDELRNFAKVLSQLNKSDRQLLFKTALLMQRKKNPSRRRRNAA
jgi:transcriptional regulator with XRE-family HTH domain